MKYRAYLRCSTEKQTLDRQELQLKEWCKANNVKLSDVTIYREKRSGKNTERPVLNQIMQELQSGECLLIAELSRAHRNMANVRKMWQELSDRNVYIVVMNYKMLDTRPKDNDSLANKLIVNIMLDVLAFITEEERLSILERTKNGRKAAKNNNVKFGRPTLTKENLPKEFTKIYEKYSDKLNKKELLALINTELEGNQKNKISRTTFYNYIELMK